MSQSYILLVVILILGAISKNTSVLISVGVLLLLKLLRLKTVLAYADTKGMDIGLTIMMIGLLASVATGKFGVTQFTHFIKNPVGILALVIGIGVTLIARQGVLLMSINPAIVPMAIAGVILGVVLFKGVSVGPLIASGLTAVLYGLVKLFWK